MAWVGGYSPYFRLRRSRATASERAMVRARVSVYAFVRDWVRVRVGIRLEG